MKGIKELTIKELIHIADLATGGYCNSEWSSLHEEVEVGGYGKRRRLEWLQKEDRRSYEHYFEISAENSDGWAWHCQARNGEGKFQIVNTIAPHRIVDYLRENGFNIENNG